MIPALTLGKSSSYLIKKLLKRSASTWPGHLVLKIDPNFTKKILNKNSNLKIILIAGTNGKTTTTKAISHVLRSQGKRIFTNETGANLLNGIVSSLINHTDHFGAINYDCAIFEVDENSLPIVISHITPSSIILLNLFRDQLDRYGEVNSISKKWGEALKKLPKDTKLITNGDDPQLRFLGENSSLHSFYFGIDEKYMTKKRLANDSDSLYCPHCNSLLTFSKIAYSHQGMFKCLKCGFEHRSTATFPNLKNPLIGTFNFYNMNAAALLLQKEFGISEESIQKTLSTFSPAFGRQEKIEYKGKNIFLLLSKNPTGFNQSIQAVLSQNIKPYLLLSLNDRVPDGRDISWIWDVDFEELENASNITITGDRAYDMGLRIKYADIDEKKYTIEPNLLQAIEKAISMLPGSETLYVLPTYSSMLEIRKILKGQSIL